MIASADYRAAVVLTLGLLAACSTQPLRPEPARPPGARVASATATPAKMPPAAPARITPSGAAAPPSSAVLEEQNVGEVTGLTPAPEAAPDGPAQLAALPSPAVEAAAPSVTSAEPESLLIYIEPTTAPNVAAALRLIEDGRQQMKQGGYDQALDRFERAVAIDPTHAYGYYFLAQLHYLKKHYDQAIAFSSRAVVLSARTDRIWLGHVYSLRGAVFEDVGRYPDARKAYQKAVEADPNNLAARVGVARLNPE